MNITTTYEIVPNHGSPNDATLVIRVFAHGKEIHSFYAMSDRVEAVEAYVKDGTLPNWALRTKTTKSFKAQVAK